ncbi:hypothetical protein BZG36_00028 [Bifiguratus adelaidae]|uniref:EF-hand domain-containing protein n=1 Tax=Bifiguratus adelaidae TaxID=1938954 RepID=A0A261Y8B6_9FUNG|nr:hypothetical protein BZG36_00028 [Bifiguratus adelaidae]
MRSHKASRTITTVNTTANTSLQASPSSPNFDLISDGASPITNQSSDSPTCHTPSSTSQDSPGTISSSSSDTSPPMRKRSRSHSGEPKECYSPNHHSPVQTGTLGLGFNISADVHPSIIQESLPSLYGSPPLTTWKDDAKSEVKDAENPLSPVRLRALMKSPKKQHEPQERNRSSPRVQFRPFIDVHQDADTDQSKTIGADEGPLEPLARSSASTDTAAEVNQGEKKPEDVFSHDVDHLVTKMAVQVHIEESSRVGTSVAPLSIQPMLPPLPTLKRSSVDDSAAQQALIATVADIFKGKVALNELEFLEVTKACLLPRYMNLALFRKIDDSNSCSERVTFDEFKSTWSKLCTNIQDQYGTMYAMLKNPELNYVVCNHPGLEFLADNTLFQELETVILRIFYDNRCMTGKMTLRQFRKSALIKMLTKLEQGIDLNLTHDCFSYKHFYVIYCKFWELDQDHDLIISEEDLTRYNGFTLTGRIINRIIRYGKPSDCAKYGPEEGKPRDVMSYLDFICKYKALIALIFLTTTVFSGFLLSEVDKNTTTAIEYWFRCMDIDGDGVLSTFELAYFYEEQMSRQIMFGIPEQDRLKFEDAMCQANDLIRPAVIGQITLQDLKRSKLAERFFDMFTNFSKLQMHESTHNSLRLKRQFLQASLVDLEDGQPLFGGMDVDMLSEWCAYAEAEYQNLVMNDRIQTCWEDEEEEEDFDNVLGLQNEDARLDEEYEADADMEHKRRALLLRHQGELGLTA